MENKNLHRKLSKRAHWAKIFYRVGWVALIANLLCAAMSLLLPYPNLTFLFVMAGLTCLISMVLQSWVYEDITKKKPNFWK